MTNKFAPAVESTGEAPTHHEDRSWSSPVMTPEGGRVSISGLDRKPSVELTVNKGIISPATVTTNKEK